MQMQQKQLKDLNEQIEAMRQAQSTAIRPDDMGYNRMGGGTNKYGIQKAGYTMLRDKDGNLDARFQETLDPTLAKLRDKFDVEGDTKWATLQREQLANQMSEAEDRARLQGNTALATAQDRLAMRGGLRGGAGERMMMGNQRALMSRMQGLGAENRAGNLRLSIADEEMKNKVLGQVGQTSQGIQGRNISTLRDDIANQNQFEAQRYSDDMQAYGARETAKAQRKASCFTANTLVKMLDGTKSAICKIKIGDVLAEGGKVEGCVQALSDDVYNYNGVEVAGSHAVKEDGTWVRVRDSKKAEKVNGEFTVYNLMVSNHLIFAGDDMFSDFFETEFYEDLTEAESLEVLNGKDARAILQK